MPFLLENDPNLKDQTMQKPIAYAAIAATMMAVTAAAIAGSPRCAGSYEPEKCEKLEAQLASETPEQKAARASSLDKSREANVKQANKEAAKRAKMAGVAIGMSAAEVLASSWGRPQSVNRTINANGTSEQWVYGGRNYLYFEHGVLTSIQN